MKACVLRIEGTNCEDEMKLALDAVKINTEIIHLKQITGECNKDLRRDLFDYDLIMLPGGWSAGDYVRAGAIFAARMKSKLKPQFEEFIQEGRLLGGICNGFQILVEFGILPGFEGIGSKPEAVLTNNSNARFQCRPSYLKHVNSCAFTGSIPLDQVLQIPVAHAEGRLSFGDKDTQFVKQLVDNNQIVFTYCTADGQEADGIFPINPNGSVSDIAGICNPEGNVLGMMPHPERVISAIQQADWTRKDYELGDGKQFFESIAGYLKKKG